MKIVVGFLIVACVVGFLLSRRPPEKPAAAAPIVSAPSAQSAAPREPSEHNWPKRALDRVGDVKRQVAAQRAQDDAK